MIYKLSDIIPKAYYHVCFVGNYKETIKMRFMGFINEHENGYTELYLVHKHGGNLCFAVEIGIGNTKEEAIKNYGKFKYENIKSAYNNLNELLQGINNDIEY